MKIKRTINEAEVEIELTEAELFAAFQEQEHLFDRENVMADMDTSDAEDFEDTYGVAPDVFLGLLDDIAYEMRHQMDKYGYALEDARSIAIKSVVEQYHSQAQTD